SRPGKALQWMGCVLEDELGAKLDAARRMAGRDRAEAAVADIVVHAGEALVIPGVEELAAKLERNALDDLEVFDCRQVPIVVTGTEQVARTLAAEMVHGGSEGCRGKPSAYGL